MSYSGQSSTPKQWNSKAPRGYQQGYLQQYSPDQMQLHQQNFSRVGPDSYLSKIAGGDEEAMQQMEAPAWRNFNASQGQMGSRFSGMGMGAQKSSGFKNSMGQMGSDFAQDLASKRHDYRRQALNDLMGFSDTILGQRPYDQFMAEKGPSNFEKFMNYYVPMTKGTMKAAAGGM